MPGTRHILAAKMSEILMEGPYRGLRHAVCNIHKMLKYKWNALNSIIFALHHSESALMLVVGQMTSFVYILIRTQSHIFWSNKPTSLKISDHVLSIFSVSDQPWQLRLSSLSKKVYLFYFLYFYCHFKK